MYVAQNELAASSVYVIVVVNLIEILYHHTMEYPEHLTACLSFSIDQADLLVLTAWLQWSWLIHFQQSLGANVRPTFAAAKRFFFYQGITSQQVVSYLNLF